MRRIIVVILSDYFPEINALGNNIADNAKITFFIQFNFQMQNSINLPSLKNILYTMGKITDKPGNPDDQRKEGVFFFREIKSLQDSRYISSSYKKKDLPLPRKRKKKARKKISVPAISER